MLGETVGGYRIIEPIGGGMSGSHSLYISVTSAEADVWLISLE